MKHTILVILFVCGHAYLFAQSRLVTWGSDANGLTGQGIVDFDLGPGNGPTIPGPNTPTTCFDDWQSIFFAGGVSYGIRQDGSLWTWGVGYNTGLPESERDLYGGGNFSAQAAATQVGIDKNWRTVSGGGYSTIGVKTDGTLWGWGLNTSGELGLGHTNAVITPQRIGTESNWKEVSVSTGYTMAIKTDGTLWAWGTGTVLTPGLISLQNDWVTLSTGDAPVRAAIRRDGTLWIWGTNTIHNMLGMGSLFGTHVEPEPVRLTNDHDWKAVTMGGNFVIAQKTDGSLWGWGSNAAGQLGDGTFTDQNTPHDLGLGTGWEKVSAGSDYVLALKGGSIWAWGRDAGATPHYGNTPVPLSAESNWQDISVGAGLGMALQTGPHKPVPVPLELGSPISSCGATATITANIAGAYRYKWYRPSGGPVAGGQTFTATTPGTYKLTITKGGCRMTDQVTVTLNDVNNTAFQASGTAIDACAGFFDIAQPVTFTPSNQTGGTVTWSFGNGVTSTEQTPQYTYPSRGQYTVTLTNNCGGSTTHDIGLATPLILADAAASCGAPVTLSTNITAADAYRWQTPAGTEATTPAITASAGGTFTATVTQGTCVQSGQVQVDLSQSNFQPEFSVVSAGIVLDDASTILRDIPLTVVGAGLDGAKSYTWTLSDGTPQTGRTFNHTFASTGDVTITLTATDDKGCTGTIDQHFHIRDLTINDAISANADGLNDNLHFDPLPYTSTLKVTDQHGRTVFTASPYQDDFTGNNLPSGVYYYELSFKEIGKSYKGSVHVMR